MRRYIKYIISACFIFLCIGLFLCFYTDTSTVTTVYTSEVLIYKDGVEYEVKLNNNTNETFFREGDTEEVIYSYPRKDSPSRLSLPELENIKGEDVLSVDKLIIDFTYDIPYLEGSKYIKYLMDNGYSIEMYICNSQYFECFLKNTEEYKRVVLFVISMMVCDMSLDTELPNVADYLENYNYNNYMDNKFRIEEMIK